METLAPSRWSLDQASAERAEAVATFGFTDRQARFLVQVLLHAGVFVERQYCQFAGIVHGQKTSDFLARLVERRYATAVSTGPLHRGRLFHVHYKPLWTAVGEPDSRYRKPAVLGRLIERVMRLDAVLDDPSYLWLGPSRDKLRHFATVSGDRLRLDEFPRLTFGVGPAKTVRYFPDKLPIGVQPYAPPHVLLYLVTNPSPADFRAFLLRHLTLLGALREWTIRLLVPTPLAWSHASSTPPGSISPPGSLHHRPTNCRGSSGSASVSRRLPASAAIAASVTTRRRSPGGRPGGQPLRSRLSPSRQRWSPTHPVSPWPRCARGSPTQAVPTVAVHQARADSSGRNGRRCLPPLDGLLITKDAETMA